MINSRTLMVQGTSSDAGKSVLCAGLCRLLRRRGLNVAPMKPQNMALNSAVTEDGGEIGRAQAVQALAAGVAAHTDMNPVLLKPNSDTGAQVIIQGKAIHNMEAACYHDYKTTAMTAVLDSYQRLQSHYDFIVVEGAGSPAEINLRDRDIANMGFAETVDCPVILVADIDRGGVFAQIVGTLELLSQTERDRVVGFVINRFRGDIALLQPGLDWLEQKTGKPVLGVLPYLQGFLLEAEDAIESVASNSDARIRVHVPVLSRISNHTDFDALALHPDIDLHFVGPGQSLRGCDWIILPGSKSVRRDLDFLRQHGWEQEIAHHLRYGGRVLGICGGFQMLGSTVADPLGIEGSPGETAGLAYFDMRSEIQTEKTLRNSEGMLHLTGDQELGSAQAQNVKVKGYEIHAGISTGAALQSPLITLSHGPDGARSADDQVLGTYLHGLFDASGVTDALLLNRQSAVSTDRRQLLEQNIDRLADALEQHLDLDRLPANLLDLAKV